MTSKTSFPQIRQALIGGLAAVAAAFAGFGGAHAAQAEQALAVPQVTVTFAPTTADFPNPDRGFYGWAGSDFVSNFDLGSVSSAYSNGLRLVHASVSLGAYRNADLPASFLTTLGDHLAAVRSAGMKVTLLFAYDFSGSGNDASSDRIRRHLEQLKPVLAANAAVIPYMRAGFIGAWGEWHSSQSGNSCGYNSGNTSCDTANANRAIVRDALLANVPITTQIGFRYPADLQRWYPAADGPARAASHNDCFLAGPSDSGTFADSGQRTYLRGFTNRSAFGGETCDNAETPVRNTCADILTEGAQYHLAWLNSTYAASVLNAWKAGGCYSTVSRTMGYRIQLDSVAHNPNVTRGNSLAVAVDLRNVGWAKLFGARKLVVTLRHRATGATIAASAGHLEDLPAQATSSTRIMVNVPVPADAAIGTYEVLLSTPDAFAATRDDPRFAVRYANADQAGAGQTWNDSAATFSTGTSVKVN